MNKEQFEEAITSLNIKLTEQQKEQLEKYYELLIEWNQKFNLTRITEKSEVYLKHFYDSLTLNKAIDFNTIETVCDIGTGAGFPGLVLKIVFPHLKVTLVDSLQKRINFLDEIIRILGLKEVYTVHSRGEDYARIHREEYDLVTSRAVAELRIISEICIPLVKEKGYFIPMKANINEELEQASSTLNKLNATVEQVITFYLPKENSIRNLVKIKKESKTDKKYPRSVDKIKKIAL